MLCTKSVRSTLTLAHFWFKEGLKAVTEVVGKIVWDVSEATCAKQH